MNNTFQEWIALLGLIIPFCALSYAAVMHVKNKSREMHHMEYQKLMGLVRVLDDVSEAVYSKIYAAHELRYFPRYKILISKLADQMKSVEGEEHSLIREQLRFSAKHLGVKY